VSTNTFEAEQRERVQRYIEQRLQEVNRNRTGGVVTLDELQAIRQAEQQVQAAVHRADSAASGATQHTSPQIQHLERQLARQKRHAELTAKAGPGRLLEVAERDESGRLIRTYFGDPAACWDAFKHPTRILTGWKTRFDK
jgi:hypothetical protein